MRDRLRWEGEGEGGGKKSPDLLFSVRFLGCALSGKNIPMGFLSKVKGCRVIVLFALSLSGKKMLLFNIHHGLPDSE